MPSRRQFLRVAAASTMSVPLAGCVGGKGATDSGATITWLTSRSNSDTTVVAVKQIAEAYRQRNPGFSLEVQSVPSRPAYLQRIKILASSNRLPAWFDADPEPYFAEIAATGILADIDSLYRELEVDRSFYPISTEYPRLLDGSLKLLTWNANVEYFFYNRKVFSKARATPPRTLNEIPALCDKITRNAQTPAIALAGSSRWPYYRFLAMPAFRATGNQFLTDLSEGSASMLNRTGLESSSFLQQIGQRGFQEGFTTADATTALNLMTSGRAAMYYTGSWDIGNFLTDDGRIHPDIGYFPMPPAGPSDATAPSDFFVNSGIGTAIRKDALTEQMKDFLAFLFKAYPDTLLYEHQTLPSLKPEIRDSLPEVYQRLLQDVASAKQYAHVWDVVLDAGTVDTLSRVSETLTLGLTTPRQFGSAIDTSIQTYQDSK